MMSVQLIGLADKGLSTGAVCTLAGTLFVGSIIAIIVVTRAHRRRLAAEAPDPLFGTAENFYRPISEALIAAAPPGATHVELVLDPAEQGFRIHDSSNNGKGALRISTELKKLIARYAAHAKRHEGGLRKITFAADKSPDGEWDFSARP